jgi:CRISPR/Cas system-associated exonuclease Cas4 (RecB family)
MGALVSTITELIKNEHQRCIDSNDRDYSYFHPSEFHRCVRYLAYKYYGETSTDKIKPDLQRIFDNGHYMHDRYTSYFRNIGVLNGFWVCANPLCGEVYGPEEKRGIPEPNDKCAKCGCEEYNYKEVNFRDEDHMLGGSIDGILNISNSFVVIDYKTMNSNLFGKLNSPLDKHIIQVSVYMWAMGVDKAILLYENKDTQRMKVFEVNISEDMVEKILKRAKSLKRIVEKGNLPKRPFKKDSPQCKKCPYKGTCWKQT